MHDACSTLYVTSCRSHRQFFFLTDEIYFHLLGVTTCATRYMPHTANMPSPNEPSSFKIDHMIDCYAKYTGTGDCGHLCNIIRENHNSLALSNDKQFELRNLIQMAFWFEDSDAVTVPDYCRTCFGSATWRFDGINCREPGKSPTHHWSMGY